MKPKERPILVLLVSFMLAACAAAGGARAEAETRVLFIGNSHTYNNDLPKLFESMARANGYDVSADMVAHGGWTLLEHAQSAETIEMIRSADWDYVVLQEQGDIPSFADSRDREMYPAIRGLHNEISAGGAETVLFMTWGHRDGSLAAGVGGYGAESALVERTYVAIGDELDVRIAPIGVAWWNAMRGAPGLSLWVDDGNHATKEGSYLAASVLYHVILGQSPETNRYTAGIPDDWALFYQSVAAQTVSANAARWNLP